MATMTKADEIQLLSDFIDSCGDSYLADLLSELREPIRDLIENDIVDSASLSQIWRDKEREQQALQTARTELRQLSGEIRTMTRERDRLAQALRDLAISADSIGRNIRNIIPAIA